MMKIQLVSRVKHCFWMALLSLTSLVSQYGHAASVPPDPNLPPEVLDLFIPHRISPGVCSGFDSCTIPDGVWTKSNLPLIQVGEAIPISTTSSSFSFYLGNSLSGAFDVSLTPYFHFNSGSDDLVAAIFDRKSSISTTNYGAASFEANYGTDYYLLLEGRVHGGQTYELQVSQVPLLPSWVFMSFALSMVAPFTRRLSKRMC